MAFALRIASGRGRGRRFRFEGQEICIGRSALSDLILNDAGVSRTHARIQRQGEGWVLLDCDSANGTQLNGAAVTSPAQLRKGDLIRVGAAVFRFEPAARRGRAPLRLAVAAAAGLVLIAAGSAAFLHGSGRRHDPAPDRPAALAWTPDTRGIAGGSALAAHPEESAGRVAEPGTTAGAETGPIAVPDPARAAYERGRRKLDERRIAPRNLYDAWSAFTESRRLLEGASPDAAASRRARPGSSTTPKRTSGATAAGSSLPPRGSRSTARGSRRSRHTATCCCAFPATTLPGVARPRRRASRGAKESE